MRWLDELYLSRDTNLCNAHANVLHQRDCSVVWGQQGVAGTRLLQHLHIDEWGGGRNKNGNVCVENGLNHRIHDVTVCVYGDVSGVAGTRP
jgi:hypothetical protein